MGMLVDMDQIEGLWDTLAGLTPVVQASRGAIFGMTLSNNVAAPTLRVDIAVGKCRDAADTDDIVLASGITKRLDATWSLGTAMGGLDQGTKAANTGYHVYAIYNPTTQVTDALFSASATNPTLPTGFTKYRRLGAVMTDNSGNIRAFSQKGDWFILKQRGTEWANTDNGNANVPVLREITVPQGRKMLAMIYYQSSGDTSKVGLSGCFDPDEGVPESMDGAYKWGHIRRYTVVTDIQVFGNPVTSVVPITTSYGTGVLTVWTNSNRQIYTMSNDSLDVIAGGTIGWMDDRGQYD